jgi:hypothetical protein
VSDVPAKALLQRMATRLDEQVQSSSERRIVPLAFDELDT